MNQQKVETLIKNWFNKADVEKDTFSKFVFLWFCINAWIAHKTREGADDREMIEALKSGFIADLKTAYDESKKDIDLYINKLIGMGSINNDTRSRVVTITDNNDFKNIVEAIYTIRNNLFHGKKDPDDEKRDEPLVLLAGNILDIWIEKLISSWYVKEKLEITKNILERISKRGEVINYGALYGQIGLDAANIVDRNMGCDILAEVNNITLGENNIMLSSVVTSKEKNEPYDGYYKYASIKGKLKNESKIAFWIAELEKCHNLYKQK